jgi:hypothetical protein
MSLGGLDRPTFQWGDSFTYELVVKNTGIGVIQIPYSRDFAKLKSSAILEGQLVTARLVLSVLKPETGELLDILIGNLDSLELRGSNTISETIVRPRPNEELTMKVPAQWVASDRVIAGVLANNGAIRVIATLMLAEQGTVGSSPAVDAFVFKR